jgi:hypothetical protein
MSEKCRWLHEQLEQLQLISYPILDRNLKVLPDNGIYFFYEEGENWGHGVNKLRIVRVGTHRDGNFRNRIAEHFLLNESKMDFGRDNPKPSDRSIFRKNIGRALLNRANDDYLRIWEIDFMGSENKQRFAHMRDIRKEREIEAQITHLLRTKFSFRLIELIGQAQRMGKTGLEGALIGTLARCAFCRASTGWLGKYSPKKQISQGKLWLVQHLSANSINEQDERTILEAVRNAVTTRLVL